MPAREARGSAEHEESDSSEQESSDSSSAAERELRRAVVHPYREGGREALLAQRRRKKRELEQAEKAAERRERLKRELAFIDEELRLRGSQLLETIAPAGSCSVSWEQMRGSEVVRRCHRCQRDVYDFAKMTDGEIEGLFVKLGPASVQLRRRADGRVVSGECANQRSSALARGARMVAAGMVFGAAATVGASLAEWGVTSRALLEEPPDEHLASLRPALASVSVEPLPPREADELSEPNPSPPSGASLDLAQRIRWIAPEAWEVDRTLFMDVLASPGAIPRGHLVPAPAGGLQVRGVRRGELFAHLGLRNGDRITELNGMPIENMGALMDAYQAVRESDALFVRLIRRGEGRLHVYRIAP